MSRALRYGILLILAITAVNLSFSLIFRIVARELPESIWLRFAALLAASLLSASSIALIVVSTAPVLREWLLTYRQLTRLLSTNHSLLVRLSKEAPGTYHHSLLVADLAAKAAKSIGADGLLTRIAGYFHDTGKLAHPEFFVENQRGRNPHEDLKDPGKSAAIIINHVKAGIELAKEHGLPKEVIDCIPQHHGTLLLKQFYEEAKQKNPAVSVREFRYPGPRPLSREAGLLMLADNAEARVRALPTKSFEAVKEAVEEAVSERYRERQLDVAGFTEDDFIKIRDSFTESFLALHHRRLPRRRLASAEQH